MIWLTWRQHRAEAIVLGCTVAAAAVVMVALDLALSSHGQRRAGEPGSLVPQLTFLLLFLPLLPALLGMFIGAPLVARELERGTHRLVWAQSVTRGRWLLLASAGVLALGAAAIGVFTLLLGWSFHVLAPWQSGFGFFMFDVLGVAPIAYTVFALTLGTAAGTLLRRTLPAMIAVLVLFIAVRAPIGAFVRPAYLPPVVETRQATTSPLEIEAPPGAWLIESGFIDPKGNRTNGVPYCDGHTPCPGYRSFISYQPADRFWLFQGIEASIYLALSALLLALSVWWVRRRVT